jgi:hypothetical protein
MFPYQAAALVSSHHRQLTYYSVFGGQALQPHLVLIQFSSAYYINSLLGPETVFGVRPVAQHFTTVVSSAPIQKKPIPAPCEDVDRSSYEPGIDLTSIGKS